MVIPILFHLLSIFPYVIIIYVYMSDRNYVSIWSLLQGCFGVNLKVIWP